MTNKDYSDITAIVDESGSMAYIKLDTEGGLNSFIEDQKKEPGIAKFSLVTFDDKYTSHYVAKDLSEVKTFVLKPRGTTALLDAIGRTVTETGARLAALPEDERPDKVIIVILTDGYENASREWTRESVAKIVKEQTDKYNWTFLYLGANQDAITEAAKFGIAGTNALTYDVNNVGQTMTFASAAVAATRGGTFAGYTQSDRDAAVQ